MKNQNEENARFSQTDTPSSTLVLKIKLSESLKRARSSVNQENRISPIDILNGLHGTNTWLHLQS